MCCRKNAPKFRNISLVTFLMKGRPASYLVCCSYWCPSSVQNDIRYVNCQQLYRLVNTEVFSQSFWGRNVRIEALGAVRLYDKLWSSSSASKLKHTHAHVLFRYWMSDIIPLLFTAQANSINYPSLSKASHKVQGKTGRKWITCVSNWCLSLWDRAETTSRK